MHVTLPGAEKLNSLQAVHASEPIVSLNLPASHNAHDPAGPEVPGKQMGRHEASLTLPSRIVVLLAGHSMHSAAPARFEYFAASHSIQSPSFVFSDPAAYVPCRQLVQMLAPAAAKVPAWHTTHAYTDAAPVVSELFPASHSEQGVSRPR